MTERLLAFLNARANRRGIVIVAESTLLSDLGATSEAVATEIEKLERAGLVQILSHLPFLALKLRSWSGSSAPRVQREQQNSTIRRPIQEKVPVSSIAAAATQQREVGGAGEGEALLDQVLQALGPEADRGEFRTILAGHHPTVVHRALRRVEATRSIRVSRAALFRSLLQKLSH